MEVTKTKKEPDLISECIKNNTMVYGFVISNPLADEFIELVKTKGGRECEILVSLVKQWIKENQD